MTDEPSVNPDAETGGPAPSVPKPAREPIVIEGDAADVSPKEPARADSDPEAAVGEPDSEAPAEAAPEPEPTPQSAAASDEVVAVSAAPRRRGAAFGFGLLGALVGAGAALAGAWVYDPRADSLNDLQARQRALESTAMATSAAVKTDETRLAAIDALDKRLSKLEASAVKPDALLALQSEVRAAHAAADKAVASGAAAPGGPPAPDPRIDKLESDEVALAERIGKLEAALSAPKSEARVAPSDVTASAGPAAQAVAALALDERFRSGQPFGREWAALSRMGADAGALAALKPYAESGAPTPPGLAAQFAKLATGFAAPATPETGGVMDRLLDHMRKLVKVRPVGEIAGEDPAALATQIEAALARGDIGAALTTYAKLPEAARTSSGDWAKSVNALAGAQAAARGLRESAMAKLAPEKT